MTRLRARAIALSTFLLTFGCNELEDPSFDFSCASGSCPWQVDEGEVRKVGTWNEYDEALEFLDTPTAISQRVDDSIDCTLEVEVFGLVEPGSDLTVALDADDDGTIDAEAEVSALGWESTTLRLEAYAAEEWRLILKKSGSGRVVLGHVFAECAP